MRVVEAKSQVEKAQREFEKAVKAWTDNEGTIIIGGPGFHDSREVSWSERLGTWWTTYLVARANPEALGALLRRARVFGKVFQR